MSDTILQVNNFYAYSEKRVEKRIEFGWINSGPIKAPLVITLPIDDPQWNEWSQKEGVSGASLSDYQKYFKGLAGKTPKQVLSTWPDRESFVKIWTNQYPDKKIEEAYFIFDLALLLERGQEFEWAGRKFQIVR